MEPAALKGFAGGMRFFFIAPFMTLLPRIKISPIVLAVAGHRLEGLRIGDHQPFQHEIADALSRLQRRLLFDGVRSRRLARRTPPPGRRSRSDRRRATSKPIRSIPSITAAAAAPAVITLTRCVHRPSAPGGD